MSTPGPGIVSVAEAAAVVQSARAAGDVVVMCHGCFDIVHPGHVRHLQHARTLGDRLLVTVTGDAAIEKGSGRPLIPQELRAENLAALDCVDWVALSDHPTAVPLLETIRPDVYVKGREYELNQDPRFLAEKEIVERFGGRVVFTSGDVVFSSTALISAIEETANPALGSLRRLINEHDLGASRLEGIVRSFHGKRVLVVGETIVDTYVICDRPNIASEGPVMTLRPIESRSFDGGAAVIARHLAAMGARPTLLTALPQNAESETMRLRLEVEGLRVQALDVDRKIMEKQRFLVGTSKVMKLDLGQQLVLDSADRRRLVDMAASLAREADAVILADFGLGLLTAPMLSELCARVRPLVDVLVGDVSGRRSNLLAMQQMDMLCPSEVEIRDALNDYEEGLSAVVWRLLDRTRSRSCVVTLGDDGLIAFDQIGDGETGPGRGAKLDAEEWAHRLHAEPVPSLASHVVDQLGCGDALLAAATLTLVSGESLRAAAILGSLAAAAQAQKLGNAVIGSSELRRGIRHLVGTRLVLDRRAAASIVTDPHDQLSAAHSEPS